MVFNHEVLFIHLGKTGGSSITQYLIKTLKPPVVLVENAEYCQLLNVKNCILVPGLRHANLYQANELVKKFRITLSDFKLIFIVIRDPVEIELSHYKHLRKEKVINRLKQFPEQDRGRIDAAQLEFCEFAKTSITHFTEPLPSYFNIDNMIPNNLQIIRFEHINKVLPEILKPFQNNNIPFPHKNMSDEKIDISGLSIEAINNIKAKYSWIYENGFYTIPTGY